MQASDEEADGAIPQQTVGDRETHLRLELWLLLLKVSFG